ncbi:hypothetical protein Bbelb_230460 [Branchiostoma belcheri]|nr:hypothetical protein Bbelb_230460 [Branchiostoma belcheri]
MKNLPLLFITTLAVLKSNAALEVGIGSGTLLDSLRVSKNVAILQARFWIFLDYPEPYLSVSLCSSDQDCIDVHGYGSCCAPRVNFFSPVPQCKPATEGGKVCFLESNNMPYSMKRLGARMGYD